MRKIPHIIILVVFAFILPEVYGQANGNLQLHFIDVGQGDSCLLISPGGETVLFDDGTSVDCSKPVEYHKKLKLSKIDYHIASCYAAGYSRG